MLQSILHGFSEELASLIGLFMRSMSTSLHDAHSHALQQNTLHIPSEGHFQMHDFTKVLLTAHLYASNINHTQIS